VGDLLNGEMRSKEALRNRPQSIDADRQQRAWTSPIGHTAAKKRAGFEQSRAHRGITCRSPRAARESLPDCHVVIDSFRRQALAVRERISLSAKTNRVQVDFPPATTPVGDSLNQR
jgi:hypothetical protein